MLAESLGWPHGLRTGSLAIVIPSIHTAGHRRMKHNLVTRSVTGLALSLFGLVTTPPAYSQVEAKTYTGVTESRVRFRENCAVCHGENLEGAPQGSPLRGPLRHGETVAEIVASLNDG